MPLFSLVGKISLEGADKAESALKRIKADAHQAGEGFKDFGRLVNVAKEALHGVTMVAVGATAAMAPLALAAGSAFNAFADYDSLTRGLATTTRSAQELIGLQRQIQELAKLPGLGEQEAGQSFLTLRSAGLEASLALRSITSMGNALASVGKGKADLDGVVTAISQIASKGVVSAEEINQIAERVPQIRTLLAGAFGTADTQKIQAMGLTATDAIARIVAEAEKLPKATGGVRNDIENITDTINRAQRPFGQGLSIAFSAAGPFVEKFIGNIERLGRTVGELVAAVGQSGVLGEALSSWGVAFEGMDGTIAHLLASVMSVAKNLPTFFSDAAGSFQNQWEYVGKWFGDLWGAITKNVGVFFRNMTREVSTTFLNMVGEMKASWLEFQVGAFDFIGNTDKANRLRGEAAEERSLMISRKAHWKDSQYVPLPSFDFGQIGLGKLLGDSLFKDTDRFTEMITNGRRKLPLLPDGLNFGGGSSTAGGGDGLFAQWDKKLSEIERNTGRAASALESRQVFGAGPEGRMGATPAEMSQARLGPDPYTRSVSATMQEAVRRITLQDQMGRVRRAYLYGR